MNLRSHRYFGRNRVRLAAITVLAPVLGLTLASTASAILAISDRLLRTSSAYPHVASGTIVGSSAFLTA